MIILVRHGEAKGAKGRYIGRTDLPLSDMGKQQALHLGQALAGRAMPTLYTSPLLRCRDTASIMAQGTDAQASVLDALAEINMGSWDGHLRHDIKREQPRAYAARGIEFAHFRAPGGESFADVQARARQALHTLSSGPQPALAVTHAGVIRCLLCHVLGMPLEHLFRLTPSHGRCTVLLPVENHFALHGFNLAPESLPKLLAS